MKFTVAGLTGALWGLTGIELLLGTAIWRLIPAAEEVIRGSLSGAQALLLVSSVMGMAYAEGYRGFQRAFSPRVAARARFLAGHPRGTHLMLAPLFCLGFIHATPRRRKAAFLLTLGILLLVLLARQLSQPWRGSLDAGVIAGLAWGMATVAFFGFKAFHDPDFSWPADLPGEETPNQTGRQRN